MSHDHHRLHSEPEGTEVVGRLFQDRLSRRRVILDGVIGSCRQERERERGEKEVRVSRERLLIRDCCCRGGVETKHEAQTQAASLTPAGSPAIRSLRLTSQLIRQVT